MDAVGSVPLIVGLGNERRGDDAAGLLTVRAAALRAGRLPSVDVREHRGDGTALLDLWQGRAHVLLVDAFAEDGPAGRVVHLTDAVRGRILLPDAGASTHGFGPAEALELARALDRLPARVEIYAIAGSRFGVGQPPQPAVVAAARRVARALAERFAARDRRVPAGRDRT